MTRNIVTCFAISFALSFTLAYGQENTSSFTLEEAQAYAVENNDSLELLRKDIGIARTQIKETTAMGLPQINGSFEAQYFFDIPTQLLPDFITPQVYGVLIENEILEPQPVPTGGMVPAQFGTEYNLTAGVSVNQLIFDGQYIVGLQAAKAVKELSQTFLNTNEINVKARVAQLYLQTLVLSQTADLLKKNSGEIDENIAEMQVMVEEGLADRVDLDRLKLNKQRINNQAKRVENSYEVVKLFLKLQMGYPVENEIALSDELDPFLKESAESLIEKTAAPSSRPEYKTLIANRELRNLDMKRWKAGYLPSLNGFFSYSENALFNELDMISDGENWFPTTVGGFQLNLPIFDGLSKSAKIQRAKLEREKVDIQIEQFSESVRMQVAQAKNNLMLAQESHSIEEANVDLTKRIYEQAQIKYDEGVGSSFELSSALSDYYNAQSSLVQASYELINARIKLEKALGEFN